VFYFMDHAPADWHDLAAHHKYPADRTFRRGLIENGVFVFPIETKQCSVSVAHTGEDVEQTLAAARRVVSEGLAVERVSAG
jgi:glutamate-1-semialdehyde 2,1-aminomutase